MFLKVFWIVLSLMNELSQISFLLTYYSKKETDQIYLSETTRQPFNKTDLNCHLWLRSLPQT